MTTYTLPLVPECYKVVPEEGTREMMRAFWRMGPFPEKPFNKAWKEACKAAPPLNTPPVLRWDDGRLMQFGAVIAKVLPVGNDWYYYAIDHPSRRAETEQAARRAAENALGFPDGLIIEGM